MFAPFPTAYVADPMVEDATRREMERSKQVGSSNVASK